MNINIDISETEKFRSIRHILISGGVIKRVQCNALPAICPQWCIGVSGGCTVCDCSNYGPNGIVNSTSGLSVVSGGSGMSMVNPGGMIGFGTGFNSGNSQSSSAVGVFNSNLPGFNPANSGQANSFMTLSGGLDPSNPYGFGNPANLGMAAGAGRPSNPGGSTSIAGNPMLFQGVLQQTGQSGSGNLQGSIPQTGPGSGNGLPVQGTMPQTGPGSGNGQVIQIAATTHKSQTAKHSTVPVTTATKATSAPSTTAKVQQQTTNTASGTCAPLRCAPPCDKGVVLAPNGCPMCLCQP
ncbi:uncharacterized protein LOC132549505 [Ylistrum balloti]|uniref:uncharacterized protein LOC132549505 n=1 Tax=Ylistrum balloti TaxID=509963 RepID=UPI002905D155|nr:uncharacterized protein LOC132549505 [Ylistrum balloti]